MPDSEIPQSNLPVETPSADTKVISRARFDAVPAKRIQYVVLYSLLALAWILTRIALLRGVSVPELVGIATIVIQILFYLRLVDVLIIMAFPVYMIIAICVFVFIPLPGIIVMVVLDRYISKMWIKADEGS